MESLPSNLVTKLTLTERIETEEAWKILRQGNAGKAKKAIMRLGEKSPIYDLGLGFVFFLLEDLPSAEKSFQKAIANHPDVWLGHLGLGQLFQSKGQDDLAFNEYAEVLKRAPEHPWAKKQYENLQEQLTARYLEEGKKALKEGNTEKSKEAFLKSLHYSPRLVESHLTLAKIYHQEKNLQSALFHLKAASSSEPKNKNIWKEYADALFEAKQYARSLEVYERLHELDPQNAEIKKLIESIKNKLGIFELPSQYDSIPQANAITREDVAALIAVKFKDVLGEVTDKPPIIIDIATSWASRFILKTATLGIMEVYSNHAFEPKKVISRAEMAAIVIRFINFLKTKGYNFIQQFSPEKIQITDVSPDNVYYLPIRLSISYQVMDLGPDRTFQPDMSLSGKEAIKIMDTILALIK